MRQALIQLRGCLKQVQVNKTGRKELAEITGINEKLILKWVNMSHLFRIMGVASQYGELLECAVLDTVKELRNRNAENLTEGLHRTNEDGSIVDFVPPLLP